MTGPSSIVFANEEDWQMRQKCLYHTLEGTNLKSYFANFVSIIKVRITSPFLSLFRYSYAPHDVHESCWLAAEANSFLLVFDA